MRELLVLVLHRDDLVEGEGERVRDKWDQVSQQKGRKTPMNERSHLKLLLLRLRRDVLQITLYSNAEHKDIGQHGIVEEEGRQEKWTDISLRMNSKRFSTFVLASDCSCLTKPGPMSLKTVLCGSRMANS